MGNTPNVRFKRFTEDWEQRKLGDIAEFSKGSGYSKGDLIESGTPIILYGRLYTKYETSISEVDTYVEAKDGSVYSKGGEVIVPASGETAEDIARAATVDKSGVVLGGDLNVVSPNEDINSAFLAISISHGNSQRELAKKAQGKSVVHIHNEEIKNLVVPFPAKAEQNKIVEYFSNLDDLITLYQQKCDETKEFKKYMLQNMFPQKDEKVPKIRFDGFTGDWKQRKLSDVVDSVDTGKSKFDKEGSSGEYPILGSTSVIGYDDEYDYEGDFILTARVGANAGSLYRHAGKVKISDNTVFIQASQNIEFFYQLLIRFDIKRLSFGTGQPLVKASELKRLELMMPTDMEEQMRIGVYFKNLDHLITLHQQKCNTLKEFKKYMLQNMFPQKGENKCQN